MPDKIIDEKTIICECGIIIKGTSKKHLLSNLKNHKGSKKHKRAMEIINRGKRI